MEIKQSINTTVINTSKRNCKIEVKGSDGMFTLSIGAVKNKDNSVLNRTTENWLYTDELDTLIEGLTIFRDKQRNSKIIDK